MASLMNGNGAALLRDVLDADCGTGLESGHGFDEVVPGPRLATRVVGDREGHRRDLLEHRRCVPVRDARDLLALRRLIELHVVGDLAEVQVEDIEAVLLRRRPEPDVTAHPARPRERRVEAVDRDVRGADEVDLLAARLRGLDAQGAPHQATRDDVDAVEQRVRLVREELLEEGRVVDAVHDDEQLVERERAGAHPAREHEVHDVVHALRERGRAWRLRRALGEETVAPLAILEDEVAARVERAERPVEEVVVHVRRPGAAPEAAEPGVERLPAHADGVDLVDEDDALAAPLTREALRAAGEDPDDDRVDADERRRKARARDRDERRVEAGRKRFREHRLPRSGGAQEEKAALALPARTLERLAGLPDRDDATHLLLRLRLAADVRELDSPLGVTRLEGLDLREVDEEERPEEDREVEDHVEREDHEERQNRYEVADSADGIEEAADHDGDDRRLEPEAPEPDAPARDDVLLAQLLALEPEQARPRDEAVEDEVERAAEAHDDEERGEDRPVPGPALRLVEPDDERRCGDERDRRRGAPQSPPLTGELGRELGFLQTPQWLRFGCHRRSV